MELLIYLLIGLVLSCYWWNKTYKKAYEEAKASNGVEEGMAVNHLLLMMIFWPIVLVCNLYLKFKYRNIKS